GDQVRFNRLCAALAGLLAAPALGQGAPPPVPLPHEFAPPTPAQLANQFEYALLAGDDRPLPRTDDFRYSENGNVIKPWDGMWHTLSAVAGTDPRAYPRAAALDYRVQIVD